MIDGYVLVDSCEVLLLQVMLVICYLQNVGKSMYCSKIVASFVYTRVELKNAMNSYVSELLQPTNLLPCLLDTLHTTPSNECEYDKKPAFSTAHCFIFSVIVHVTFFSYAGMVTHNACRHSH